MAKKSSIAKYRKEPKYAVRHSNRCRICGRPKGYYRKFDTLYVNDLVLYNYSDATRAYHDAQILVPWLMAGGHLG